MLHRSLYLLSRTDVNNHDTYASAVVAAWTEEEARNMHPDGTIYDAANPACWTEGYPDWVGNPSHVVVTFIGIAGAGVKCGVINASFEAA